MKDNFKFRWKYFSNALTIKFYGSDSFHSMGDSINIETIPFASSGAPRLPETILSWAWKRIWRRRRWQTVWCWGEWALRKAINYESRWRGGRQFEMSEILFCNITITCCMLHVGRKLNETISSRCFMNATLGYCQRNQILVNLMSFGCFN